MTDNLLLSLSVAAANVDRLSRTVQPRALVELDVFGPGGVRVVLIQGLATFPHRG